MLKLCLNFTDIAEMRKFILELVEVQPLSSNGNGKLSRKEKKLRKESLQSFLTQIEEFGGGPYYKLYEQFYNGYIPEGTDTSCPWSAAGLFVRGFRSIRHQRSHKRRKGCWLIIELRDTTEGRNKYRWIIEHFPEERMGTNVPLPEEVVLKDKLEWVEMVLERKDVYKYADKALEYLEEIMEKKPKLFKGERIYIWEELSRVFDSMENLDRAILCWKREAQLMPDCADPYLNMGVLYSSRDLFELAVNAYLEGLKVNPNDEYIRYNLSSLFMQHGYHDSALIEANNAIIENPVRGINYLLKGDIHFNRHEYHLAITSYSWALQLFDADDSHFIEQCAGNLAFCYRRLNNLDFAKKIIEQVDNLQELKELCKLNY